MPLKVWAAAMAAAVFLAVAAAATGLDAGGQRALWREDYRRPDTIPFPEENPYTRAKAELGRRLFFDPILSGGRDRACSSCHLPDLGWADGRRRARSLLGRDLDHRTPSLVNLAWQDGPLGWDGKFRTLEAVAFGPITAPANMNLSVAEAVQRLTADPDYAAAFAAAFTDPGIDRTRIEAALATYERLIVSGGSPFDRWIAGDEAAIPEAAKRGFDLFNGRANCAACHGGWTFTDGSFHDIGVGRDADIGRGRLMPRSQALQFAFKTPTLRNAARRAAFMHDGSVPTLEAVVELYDRGGIERPSRSREIRPLALSAADRADLVAFLRVLDDEATPDPLGAPLPETPPRP